MSTRKHCLPDTRLSRMTFCFILLLALFFGLVGLWFHFGFHLFHLCAHACTLLFCFVFVVYFFIFLKQVSQGGSGTPSVDQASFELRYPFASDS